MRRTYAQCAMTIVGTVLKFSTKKNCIALNQSEWRNFFMYILLGIEQADESQISTVTRIDSEADVQSVSPPLWWRANLSLKRQDHYLLAVEIWHVYLLTCLVPVFNNKRRKDLNKGKLKKKISTLQTCAFPLIFCKRLDTKVNLFPTTSLLKVWLTAFYWCRYGDKSPKSFFARLFATVWMVTGIILLSMFTAQVSSRLTTQELKGDDHLLHKRVNQRENYNF